MIYKSIPSFFWEKPELIQSATLNGNECFYSRDFVESLPIQITDSNSVEIKFSHGASTRKDFTAPSFDYNVLLWVSVGPNGNPAGLTTNVVLNNPIVFALTQNENILIFKKTGKPPVLRLEPGNYFINIWYSGHNKGVYLNRELSIQS